MDKKYTFEKNAFSGIPINNKSDEIRVSLFKNKFTDEKMIDIRKFSYYDTYGKKCTKKKPTYKGIKFDMSFTLSVVFRLVYLLYDTKILNNSEFNTITNILSKHI